MCVAHAPPESCPSLLYTEPFELVITIVFHYCTTPPCHKINLFKRPFLKSSDLSTRKIWKNEPIAIFGLTAAITNKDEISELKQAQEERNSDLYRTSIQYTVLGNIHGKEVYLVPPQDVALSP